MRKLSEPSRVDLFGGDRPWSPSDWTSSDDRVRGGRSHSSLTCSPASPVATFHGHLDINALGGAGFASQRTDGEERWWDLSDYDGVALNIARSDGKTYTFILKDEVLPQRPDGREQSTISWEYDFHLAENAAAGPELEPRKIFVRWSEFKPTYRGREKKDAQPLDLANLKRMSIMIRSFFGNQEEDFFLSILSIAAVKEHPKRSAMFPERSLDASNSDEGPRTERRWQREIPVSN